MKYLKIVDWEIHQTYRKDRGTPPWIKVHRSLFSSSKWGSLTDSEKGQLISIWILAADKKGFVPADPSSLRKLCLLDDIPNTNKFIDLGYMTTTCQPDDNQMTTTCQESDAPETETETETEYKPLVAENKKTGDHILNLEVSHETIKEIKIATGHTSADQLPDHIPDIGKKANISENQDSDKQTEEEIPSRKQFLISETISSLTGERQIQVHNVSQNQESQPETINLSDIPEKTTNDKGKEENPVKNESEGEISLYPKLLLNGKKLYTEQKIESKKSYTLEDRKKSGVKRWVDTKKNTPAGKALKAWVLAYEKKFGEAPVFNPPRDCKILDILIKTKGYDEVCSRLQKHLEGGRFLNMPGFQTVYNDLGRDNLLQKKGKTRSILDKIKAVSQEIQDEQKLLGEGE